MPPDAVPPGLRVELRVHGVSGTSPESLLDRPLVRQVAGDRIAGFYQPRLAAERRDDRPNPFAPERPDAALLEGYNWGGLTSGSPGRAFWLLLLPFTLVNVAPRARPPARADDPLAGALTWLIWYSSRLLALTLTALFVLTAAGVGDDLIGWQCAGAADRCGQASPGWIFGKLLGTWTGGTRSGGLSLDQLLLVGALVPAVLLFVLWFSSQRTIDRYEAIGPSGAAGQRESELIGDDPDCNAVEVGLDSVRMWRNSAQVRRLRALHLQFGLATILWTTLLPTVRMPSGRLSAADVVSLPFRDGRNVALLVPIAVTVYCVVVLALPSFTGRLTSTKWLNVSRVVWLVIVLAVLEQGAGLLFGDGWIAGRYLADGRRPVDGLPGFAATFIWLFLVIVIVAVSLGAVVAVAAARRATEAPPLPHQPLPAGLRGNTSTVLALLGVFIGAVFSAGGYTFAAAWLHTGSLKPGFGEVSYIYRTFAIPEIARVATLAYSYSIGFFVLVVLTAAVRTIWAFLSATPGPAIARDYGEVGFDRPRARKIQRDIFLGQVVDRAPAVVTPLIVAGSIITAAFGLLLLLEHTTSIGWVNSLVTRITPAQLTTRPRGFFTAVSLEGTGAYLAVITMVGLVAIALAAFRVPATRRSVGILWDIASFWPRAAHPLAAPCYAERTVPDLVTRISWLRSGEAPPPVVLSAHSQGTVISAAVIMQLRTYDQRDNGPVLEGLGLLTFGCVLRRLYGRYFPVYFGAPRLAALEQILTGPRDDSGPRWRNLWRYTDYLGGQVTAGPPPVVPEQPAPPPDPTSLLTEPPVAGPVAWEWHSPDPARFQRPAGSTTYLPPKRHSDFWTDDSGYFQLAVGDLMSQLLRSSGSIGMNQS